MTTTPSLFDEPEAPELDHVKRARRTDPRTSHEAAASMTAEVLGNEQAKVLRSLAMHTGEAIRDQVATDLSQPAANVSRRITDLVTLGLVFDTGRTRLGYSGRNQTVWALTDAGRAKVEELRK